jgi:hypothetical protein
MTTATALRLVTSEPVDAAITDFLSVGSALPADQEITSVPPSTLVSTATNLMRQGNFSQLPVTLGRSVIGVFTHTSFATALADASMTGAVGMMEVDGFLLTPRYVRVTDRIDETVVRWLNE